jgi:large subunit ribosomal protein L32e
MTTEIKRLIRVRTEKGATFKRDGFGKKRQLSDSWRKPRGQHNKQREQKKAKGALPKPGFGSPIAVRGMHPSGFFEVLVSSVKELEGLDPKTQAVRISGTVGDRKLIVLQEAAGSAGLKVLNVKTLKTRETKPKKVDAERFAGAQKKDEKTSQKSKISAAPIKKDAAKIKPAAKTEAKKVQAKTAKKSAKPKAEKAEKQADKLEKKATAKKAAAKPKVKKEATSAVAKTGAKTPKSGVKKNE